MKSIQVAAAIIKKNNRILATQRGYGDYKGSWEFPGGKIEPGETAEEALVREIKEKLIFNRNSTTYKLLINIAVMLYENTIVNEDNGNQVFKDFFRNEQMHKVFELFILNFYKLHLDRGTYKVHAPKVSWKLETSETIEAWSALFDIDNNPGDRRTDIVIENKGRNVQYIFDAKYYRETFVKAYMNESDTRTRASHLNQLRGYLLDSDFDGRKIGALLYPMVNDDLKTGMGHIIQGTPMFIKTINLSEEWREIERDLLDFLNRLERGAENTGLV